MANCCRNNWVICEPIIGCCDLFNIQVPDEYEGTEVIIKITKSNSFVYTGMFIVEDGIVQIDVQEDLPEGFLNSYGGPYTLQFIDPANNSLIWFSVDGNVVHGIEWNMAYGTNQEICGLDIYE